MNFANTSGLGRFYSIDIARKVRPFSCNLSFIALLPFFFAAPALAAETTTYEYDAQGRLIKSAKSGGPKSGTQKCTSYDEAGNRTNQTVNASGCTVGAGGGGGGGGNNPPIAIPDSYGVSCLAGNYPVTHTDSDPDGDAISLLSVSGPLGASVANSTSIYVTGTNNPGTYVISYTIQDTSGATASSTLTLTWAYNPACGGGGGGGEPEQ